MKTGDWKKLGKTLKALQGNALAKEIAKANAKNAHIFEGEIVKTIHDQPSNWQPLHPATIAQKGHDKKLIETGTLQNNSSSTKKVNDFVTIVTINRGTKDGVNIAPVQEYGAVIQVTPKMRAFLHTIGIHLKKETTTIIIPPRPFVEPSFTNNLDKFQETYFHAIQQVLS